MKTRLWFIKETDKARLYSKTPPDPHRQPDTIWIPRSVIEQCTKFPNGEHHVTITDWFAEKADL